MGYVKHMDIITPQYSEFIKKYNFVTHDTHMTKGYSVPMHWHEGFEFELILDGTINHFFSGTPKQLSRGDAYLLTSFNAHALTTETDVHIMNIRFNTHLLSPEITNMLINSTKSYFCHFSEDELSYIMNRISRLEEEKFTSSFYKEITANIISEIIILFLRKTDADNETNIIPEHVQNAISYITKNFKNNITLNSIAPEIMLTPNYLGAEIKKYTGITFNDYLNNLRLKYACNLLTNTNYSIKETAFNSGYNSVDYFLFVFKKKLLTTPSAYRADNKKRLHKKDKKET